MGITSALNTGLSGLATNQSQIDVVGNNIANVNTVGFKSSRLDFKTQILQNLSYGSSPSADLGGTNPIQIGLGTQAGAITRNFTNGTPQATGVDTNLAIQGDGFFILNQGGRHVYTRDGSFQLNGLNQLVSSTGEQVLGYGVDSSFNLQTNTLSDLTIPLNALTVAQATQNASMTGSFNASGNVASTVSHLTLGTSSVPEPFYLSDGAGGVDPTNPPGGTTTLASLAHADGTSYFQPGDVVTLNGTLGTTLKRSIGQQTLTVTSTTTLADFQSFLSGGLAINTTPGTNGSLTTPGVTIPVTGNTALLTIDGNPGSDSDITIGSSGLTVTRAGIETPLSVTKSSSADGESVTQSMAIFDSLGNQLSYSATVVLTSKSDAGTTWRVLITSPDGTATGANAEGAVGMGSLSFDTKGNLIPGTSPTFNIDRSNTGALPNLAVTLNFAGSQALGTGVASSITNGLQDGYAPGTLNSYRIQNDGTITGYFDNNLSRTLGQVALATFRNNQGLVDQGSNTFVEGPNSGTAVVTAPNQGSAGSLTAGALELSNVDLSSQFVQLISASTGFSAASRIITTSNQMLQELLSASR